MVRNALRVSVCVAAATAAFGGDPRLRIEPMQPHPGEPLSITYDPKAGPLEKADEFTLVYGFNRFQNHRTRLAAKSGALAAEVAAPDDAVYFWCWVEGKNGNERDTSRGIPWDTYLFDRAGRPLEGARRLRAAILELSGQRLDSTSAQLMLIEEEMRAFPQNAHARAEWWSLRLADAGETDAARASLTREIASFYGSHAEAAWAYHAAALGYNRLNRNAQAVEVLRAFARLFPDDPRCDSMTLTILGNYGTAADLEALPRAAARWAGNRDYWNMLLNAYARSRAGAEKLIRAGKELLALTPVSRDEYGQTRYEIAETWLANGVDPAAAATIARESVAISETGPKLEMAASVAADPRARKNFVLAIHRSALGWALFLQGRYEEALEELRRAAEIRERERFASRAVYYRLGQALEKLGRPAEAMDAYARELAWGALAEPARAALSAVYRGEHGNLEGLNDFVGNRVNDLLSRSADAAAQPIEEVNAKPGRFELRGPDGQSARLSAYLGKTVIVEFWASWCGPCFRSLEHANRLMQKYPGQVAVLAVAIDSEETRPRAMQYLKDHRYPFTTLFDDESRRELPVVSVPARFLIDPQGMLRVRETGWSPEQDLVFEQKLATVVGRSGK